MRATTARKPPFPYGQCTLTYTQLSIRLVDPSHGHVDANADAGPVDSCLHAGPAFTLGPESISFATMMIRGSRMLPPRARAVGRSR